MIVSLTDKELSVLALALCVAGKEAWERTDAAQHEERAVLLRKLVKAKTRYDRMMAEATPLGLVARMDRR